MTHPRTAVAGVARQLGLPDDAAEERFTSLAREYRLYAQQERHLGNHVSAASLAALSDLAARGVELCRAERSVRILDLLAIAAVALCPVDTAVVLDDVDGLQRVTVRSHGQLVVSASHPRLDQAARYCALALLAREGAVGPACDALRGAL